MSAPSAPSSLVATAASSTQVNLTWVDTSSNETGFKIERKTGSTGTYAQIGTTLQTYETTYPGICKRYSLGQSVQGRELWAIRISDNVLVEEDEPEVKYIAAMHGTEVVGCTSATQVGVVGCQAAFATSHTS